MITLLVSLVATLAGTPSGARHNRDGLRALAAGDTAKALKELARAATDTSDSRFAYNLGTVRSLVGQGNADTALGEALSKAKSDAERARILYNRGTDRLKGAQTNGSCPNPAIEDLKRSLQLRPGWKEAARNLELAQRLRKKQEKDQDDKKDKKDKKDDQKPPPDPKQPPPKQQPKPDMDKQDAQRLLDAAQAKESENLKKPAKPGMGGSSGPDW